MRRIGQRNDKRAAGQEIQIESFEKIQRVVGRSDESSSMHRCDHGGEETCGRQGQVTESSVHK
jgi:hypothetical protein